MSLEKAEFIKNILLGVVGRRKWSGLRRQFTSFRIKAPSSEEMKKYEDKISYPATLVDGGIRANLGNIVQVKCDSF